MQTSKSFPGRYASLAEIGNFVRRIAIDAGFETFDIFSIEMAVDEACSNIIEHAYSGEEKGKIRCTCIVSEHALTVSLKDTGRSFDPSKVENPNLSNNLDDRQAHGLGLFFIHQWIDEIYFESDPTGNTMTMVKRR